MIGNQTAINEGISHSGKPFTLKELRDWRKPKTLFRRNLVERTNEEFERNPQLGLRLTLILEEAQIAALDYKKGEITEKQYLERMHELRREVGNLYYQ